jgi:beta-N-acetylglucosaminidase
LASTITLTSVGNNTSETESDKSLINIPLSIEYVDSLYDSLNPVESSMAFMAQHKEIEKEREEFIKKREQELREEEERKIQELKLELARRESVTFDPYDVKKLSYVTTEELKEVLRNTNGGDGLLPYASYFVEAEKTYGINAFFITAIAAQESGWGQKAAGNGTNLTGYAVYTRHHSGKTFKGGVRENILATTELIAENYVNPEGRYHTKWDNYTGRSIFEINQKYCLLQDQKTVDNRWSQALNKIGTGFKNTYHNIVKPSL